VDHDLLKRVLDVPAEVDLLVRTSGEVRLSDFMLWQASEATLHFTPSLWPDFSAWDMLAAVLAYQRRLRTLPAGKPVRMSDASGKKLARVRAFESWARQRVSLKPDQ